MTALVLVLALLGPPGGPGAGGKPSPAVPHLEAGSELFKQGDVAGALREFDAAAKADPE